MALGLRNRPPKQGLFLSGLLAAVLALGACESQISIRGSMPDVDDVAEIMPGQDSKQDILGKFGSPSTLSSFMDDTWYYIGQRVEQFAFYEPEVVDRSVLVVAFDDSGLVNDTRYYTLYDGRVIDPVTRETPTEGLELTFIQQVIGNIGRFPTDALISPGGVPPPPGGGS